MAAPAASARPSKSGIASRLVAWWESHLFALVSSLGRITARPGTSLMTAGVIAVSLALPATLQVSLNSLGQLSGQWDQLNQVSLFLQPGTTGDEADTLAGQLRSRNDVDAVELIDPDQALDEFSRLSGFNQALDALPDNPLPWVLVVTPGPATDGLSRVDLLVSQLGELPQVEFAQFDRQWLTRFQSLLRIGQRTSGVMAVLLGIAVLLIVGNTIRLELQSRRDEIEVSKLLGATDGFVRRPFLYLGLWYGILGGLLAMVLVSAVLLALGGPVARLAETYQSDFRLVGLGLWEPLILVGGGGLTGWLGSWLAAGRQLSRIDPSAKQR
ncbi:MAG: permease-like cell division protein FtsX [Xanthomonadales bacterium]|nr:permease-like cell division protein FtsX [Xanthomonadales bacterium]